MRDEKYRFFSTDTIWLEPAYILWVIRIFRSISSMFYWLEDDLFAIFSLDINYNKLFDHVGIR